MTGCHPIDIVISHKGPPEVVTTPKTKIRTSKRLNNFQTRCSNCPAWSHTADIQGTPQNAIAKAMETCHSSPPQSECISVRVVGPYRKNESPKSQNQKITTPAQAARRGSRWCSDVFGVWQLICFYRAWISLEFCGNPPQVQPWWSKWVWGTNVPRCGVWGADAGQKGGKGVRQRIPPGGRRHLTELLNRTAPSIDDKHHLSTTLDVRVCMRMWPCS
jgi:hypothetical protein